MRYNEIWWDKRGQMCTALYRSRAGVPLLLRAAPAACSPLWSQANRNLWSVPFVMCVIQWTINGPHRRYESNSFHSLFWEVSILQQAPVSAIFLFSFLLFGESMKNHISFSIFSLEARRLAGRHYAKASVSRFWQGCFIINLYLF